MLLLRTFTLAILLVAVGGCFGKPPAPDNSDKPNAGTRETFPLPENLPPRASSPEIPQDASASESPAAMPTPTSTLGQQVTEAEADEELFEGEQVLDKDASDPEAKQLKKQQRKQERQQLRQSKADEIMKDLNLSPDQSRQFQEAVRERREQARDVKAQILNTLTDEQKKQFKEMQEDGRIDYQALGLSSSQNATIGKLKEELRRRRKLSNQRLDHLLTPEQMQKYSQRRKRQKKRRAR